MMSGAFTVAAFIGFLGVCYWAYSQKNKAKFDDAAQLPLTDEPAVVSSAHQIVSSAAGASAVPDCCKGSHS